MAVLVCASEVGSIRSLIPIVNRFCKMGVTCYVIRSGTNWDFSDNTLINTVNAPVNFKNLCSLVSSRKIKSYLFSVNILDPLPLTLARWCERNETPTFHVLDYWNGYRSRLELDGKPMFTPTVYFVPDEEASKSAEAEGIPKDLIAVSGNPDFQFLHKRYKYLKNEDDDVVDLLNIIRVCDALQPCAMCVCLLCGAERYMLHTDRHAARALGEWCSRHLCSATQEIEQTEYHGYCRLRLKGQKRLKDEMVQHIK